MRKFLTKKYLISAAIILAVILFVGWRIKSGSKVALVPAYTVIAQDVRQTVIATGSVTSQSNLNLGFKTSGTVARVNVKIGDQVAAGQVLAVLDQGDTAASVAVAQAAVGSAQVALNNAKNNYQSIVSQQQTLVDNAQSALMNSGLAAIPGAGNISTASVTISGTYTGSAQGQYLVSLYLTGNGLVYSVSGLETASGPVNKGVPLALGNQGLFITFGTSGNLNVYDTWTVPIPNTQAATYLSNYNAYQAAKQTQAQQISVAAGAIDTNQAAVSQATAQLQVAQNAYSNNIIFAPMSGQITAVDIKVGSQAIAQKEAIVLLDQKSLHVETNIPESSIGLVKPGQTIDMTLDAFGPDKHFTGQVESIDPASVTISGVIEFRVVSSLPKDAAIKPGMTVNLNIIIADQPNVLAVPNRLIKTGNKKSVTILKNNQAVDTIITTGLVGDNFTEVTSGINAGDVIAAPAK